MKLFPSKAQKTEWVEIGPVYRQFNALMPDKYKCEIVQHFITRFSLLPSFDQHYPNEGVMETIRQEHLGGDTWAHTVLQRSLVPKAWADEVISLAKRKVIAVKPGRYFWRKREYQYMEPELDLSYRMAS